MKPSLKAILEGYGGDIEVITQAFKAEILLFFHGLNVLGSEGNVRVRLLLTLENYKTHQRNGD
jgi:hypothetical protein